MHADMLTTNRLCDKGLCLLQEESELVYDIFMHETETADSAVEENAHRRRLHGTDGSPATIIVKLKPFVFEVDGRTGKCGTCLVLSESVPKFWPTFTIPC